MIKKVLYFTDSDKDDLYSLILLLDADYLKKIDLIGIVCDDGFFNYPTNINIIAFFLKHITNYHKHIPIYIGEPRTHVINRNFPNKLLDNFLELLKLDFGYNYETKYYIENSIKNIPIYDSLDILITSNMTSLAYFLQNNTSKVNNITSMIGNINVYGNILDLDCKNVIMDAEYNSWLDVSNFRYVLENFNSILEIVPLDCTNYAPLNNKTQILIINKLVFTNSHLQNIFIKLLDTTILSEDGDIYMWDLVATLIFLDYNNTEHTYLKLDLDDNGKLVPGKNLVKVYKKIELF